MAKKIRTVGIIPARMASSRFPRKPLIDIRGVPMIIHVLKRSELCDALDDVYVATCDKEIFDLVKGCGGKPIMTSDKHPNGTDRIAEAAQNIDCDIVIRIMGDEPLVHPEEIKLVVQSLLDDPSLKAANLICATDHRNDIGEVKIVFNKNKEIIYLSREDIPSSKRGASPILYKYCGVVGFRRDFLFEYLKMEQTPLEKAEFIEELRIVENGYRLKAVITDRYSTSIDYPRDLEIVNKLMEKDDIKYKYLKDLIGRL